MAISKVKEALEKSNFKPSARYYENLRDTVRFLSSELGFHLVPVIPMAGLFMSSGKDQARGKSPSVWLPNGIPRNLTDSDRQAYKPNHLLEEPSTKLLSAIDVAEQQELPIGLGTLGRDDVAILDFDTKHFDDVEHCTRVVEQWRQQQGLENTYAEMSPTGGWHVWVSVRSLETRRNFTIKGHTLKDGTEIHHMGEVLWAGAHCVIAPTTRPDGSYMAKGPYKFENLTSLDEVGVVFTGSSPEELADVELACEEIEEQLKQLRVPAGTDGVPTLSKLLRGISRDLYGGSWKTDKRFFKPGTNQPDRSKVLTTVLNETISWLKWLAHNEKPFVDDLNDSEADPETGVLAPTGIQRMVGELEAADKFERVVNSVMRNVGRLSLMSKNYSDAAAQADYRRSCCSHKGREAIAPKDVKTEPLLVDWLLARYGNDIKYNQLTKEVEITGDVIKDPDLLYIKLARDEGVEGFSKQTAMDCFSIAAGEQPYHPVRDYLDSVRTQLLPCRGPAEGTELIPIYEIGRRYFSVDDEFQSKLVGKHLMAAVERIYRPGCKYDQVLVLRGKQGFGKSSGIAALVPDINLYYGQEGVPNDKDALMAMAQTWLFELEEVDGLTAKKSAQQMKALLSRTHDRYRAPYASKPENHPRQQVIFASTNEDRFLIDPTGERRWWVVDCVAPIDHEQVGAHRDLIWASVLHAIDCGESYQLAPADYGKSAENAASASKEAAMTDELEQWLGQKPWVLERVILSEFLALETAEISRSGPKSGAIREVSETLKRLGWTRAKQAVRDLCGQKNARDVWFAPDVAPTKSGSKMVAMFEERKLPVPVYSSILGRISFSKALEETKTVKSESDDSTDWLDAA